MKELNYICKGVDLVSVIEIKNLTKYFGKYKAVDDINLSIEKGEIVGFVGKNGAGKSTTIRSIMNMIFPTEGTISVNGLDSIKDSKEIKKNLGYMSGENEFYDNLKVCDLFKFCLKFSKEDIEYAMELSDYFELDTKKKISALSLGNKKKVSIIQALLKRADILILDEPTNGLDPLMKNRFFDLILKEKQRGVTVFLSSHNLEEVNRYCDKVAIIKNGKIVDFIEMDNIKSNQKQIVSYTTKDGQSEKFELNEDINDLMLRLSKIDIKKLEIRDKTIEEEFIDYYKGD